jgi:DNA-binding NarL/FixJ family response regulator
MVLTGRTWEVLRLIRLSNKEIAARLNISERTVKAHVSILLSSFGVSRRVELFELHDPSQIVDWNKLHPREKQCCLLAALNNTDKEIGRKLGISLSSVGHYITVAYRVLSLSNGFVSKKKKSRVLLSVYVAERGLLQKDESKILAMCPRGTWSQEGCA